MIRRFFNPIIPKTWENLFDDAKPEIDYIDTLLFAEIGLGKKIYPPRENIFTAFELLQYQDVKVVILGQDPYHGDGQAMGLSFSVPRGKTIPPSLHVIYQELKLEHLICDPPDHGDLTSWARQGVLLLNACLTVPEGTPGGHGRIWDGFISKTIRSLSKLDHRIIYVLWGRDAQRWVSKIGDNPVLICPHPAARPMKGHKSPFLGCGHFLEINKLLEQQSLAPIKWGNFD